jgi:hypothetical protein
MLAFRRVILTDGTRGRRRVKSPVELPGVGLGPCGRWRPLGRAAHQRAGLGVARGRTPSWRAGPALSGRAGLGWYSAPAHRTAPAPHLEGNRRRRGRPWLSARPLSVGEEVLDPDRYGLRFGDRPLSRGHWLSRQTRSSAWLTLHRDASIKPHESGTKGCDSS